MKFHYLAGCLLSAVALVSCNSSKTVLPYFTDISQVKEGVLPKSDYMPVLEPDDELFITVPEPELSVTRV
ncbi:MAG: hypothetical protein K2G05_01380, partial [Duncaniella sp.]|nr:hypothetical protein [Duncaniella sp.]